MASHHHHHCYSHYNQPPSHCCCPCPPPSAPPPPPPPSTAADPLLQLLAAHILQSQSPPRQPHKPSKPHKPITSSSYRAPHQPPLLHSLARRVAALELHIHNLSSPPPSTLRDAAARTIQTHFRALLARRSRTLSHLRLLAAIKSNLAVLRASSSSGKVDLAGVEVISRKAGDMLAQLDSIQCGDVMIREGKRSVGAELVQFLELMDGLAKRKTFSVKTVKKVTFANGGKEKRIYAREPEIGSDEQSELSTDDQHVSENKECSVSDDEGSHVELESFHQDDDEDNHVVNLSGNVHWGRNKGLQEHIVGGSLFAPLPIKMEPRIVEPDLVNKKKVVRIVSP